MTRKSSCRSESTSSSLECPPPPIPLCLPAYLSVCMCLTEKMANDGEGHVRGGKKKVTSLESRSLTPAHVELQRAPHPGRQERCKVCNGRPPCCRPPPLLSHGFPIEHLRRRLSVLPPNPLRVATACLVECACTWFVHPRVYVCHSSAAYPVVRVVGCLMGEEEQDGREPRLMAHMLAVPWTGAKTNVARLAAEYVDACSHAY